MFGLLKKIFKKEADSLTASPPAPPAQPAFARTVTPSQSGRAAPNPFSGGGAESVSTTPAPIAAPPLSPTAAVRAPSTPSSGELPEAIALPLNTVLAGLAPEFQNLFSNDFDPATEVQFPLQGILPQLSSGRVRVPFGELRSSCPNGSCRANAEHDGKLIELPLASVLSRINPALLPRRTQRQLMDVPKDVTGLFGSIGEPVSSASPAAAAPPSPAAGPDPKNQRRKAVPDDIESIPSPFSAKAAPTAEPAKPVLPSQRPPVTPPTAKRRSAVPEDLDAIPSPFSLPSTTPKPASPAPTAKAPDPAAEPEESTDMPKIKFNPGNLGMPAAAAPAAAPKPTPPPPPVPAARPTPAKVQSVRDDNYLTFRVADVSEGWDDAVLAEVQRENLSNSELSLPAGEVDLAMRKGKIVFAWNILRGWMSPAPGGQSANGDVEVTLPLKVVAPKFLALRKPKGGQRRAHIEESIPDLFSGGPVPTPNEEPAPATPAPEPVQKAAENGPLKPPAPAQPEAPAAPARKPAARKGAISISAANPNELVAKTSQLGGVNGALLAMNDGLVVASQLPKPLQGETVAAFLPQIFGRLNQFATELKLGDLSSVMLVMDNCPWIIFRTGKVYFAVMGAAGEALPLPQLTAIVAEIKRQNL